MFRHALAASMATACLVGVCARAEMVKNPEYENWSRFKPGAMSKLETKSVTAGKEVKSTTTNKLLEVTPEKLVIETAATMEVMGQKLEHPAMRRDVAAQMENALVARTDPAQNPDMKHEKETITVGDKKFECTVVTYTSEANGMKSVSKSWMSSDVPGRLVKTEVKTSGGVESTTQTTLVEFSTGE